MPMKDPPRSAALREHPPALQRARRALAFGLPLLAAWPAAQALEPAAGEPILTLSGRLGSPNQGAHAVFDMALLSRLPQRDIVARTPWYVGEARRFTGPLLRDVLAAAGAAGAGTLRAVALNDYRVEIPADDAQVIDVIVARLLDGKAMAVREKGPLFIMYPFDSRPDLRTSVYFNRCIWQLRAIEVT
jgi:hypothetical protein